MGLIKVKCRLCGVLLGEVLKGGELACQPCSKKKKALIFTKAV
jgi:hypothetical protein